MLNRPFRLLQPALAALATLVLWLSGSCLGQAGTMAARDGRSDGVVFRHYL